MRLFSFFLIGMLVQFVNKSKITGVVFLKKHECCCEIDSFYKKLIADKADSIFLYTEIHSENEMNGLISWKKLDSLYGITFKYGLRKEKTKKIIKSQNELNQ